MVLRTTTNLLGQEDCYTMFHCRKIFVCEIFAVTDNRENFLTAKISRYTVYKVVYKVIYTIPVKQAVKVALAYVCHNFSSCTDSLLRAQEEIQLLRHRMWLLENQLLATGTNNHALQALLQEAYQREWEHLEGRKKNAEEEMAKAQRVVSLGRFHNCVSLACR